MWLSIVFLSLFLSLNDATALASYATMMMTMMTMMMMFLRAQRAAKHGVCVNGPLDVEEM